MVREILSVELDTQTALAALAWQVELGVDEAIEDTPLDRFAAPAPPPEAPVVSVQDAPKAVPVADAASGALAQAAGDLAGLKAAMAAFDGCALKRGARNLVFADGNPEARVMIIGEAPGRDEDRIGKPFVGRSGQLLDKMFAAIGLSRDAEVAEDAIYITNTIPWRPPENRDPSTDEVTMMRPFLMRHIELAAPQVIVVMGNSATRTVLQTTTGITRMRGNWGDLGGRPVMPMFHPAALLRDPMKKREAWADLLAIKARLGR